MGDINETLDKAKEHLGQPSEEDDDSDESLEDALARMDREWGRLATDDDLQANQGR